MELRAIERDVLTQLQRGVALAERPFSGLTLPEDHVVRLLQCATQGRLVRRFGGVFDAHHLGYRSLLCAVAVATDKLADVAGVVSAHPGVTHCYAREPLTGEKGYPALWFTLSMQASQLDGGLQVLRTQLPDVPLLTLPALQRFKIDVVFDLREGPRISKLHPAAPAMAVDTAPIALSALDRQIIRRLGTHLPLSVRPFNAVANEVGLSLVELLAKLQGWQRQGMLRRVAPILYHRRAGFACNGMCVWQVDRDIAAAGQCLALRPEVTHCYQRPRVPGFAFDLFAMIHAGSLAELREMFVEISSACGLEGGQVMLSTHEFKKSSMQYFA